MQDRDRQAKNVQEQESGLHRAELKESNLRNEVQQRQHLEEKIGHQKKEVASSTSEMKVSIRCSSQIALIFSIRAGSRLQRR
jgi:DNA repair protein RAD50